MKTVCLRGALLAACAAMALASAAPASAQSASFPPYPDTRRMGGPSADLISVHAVSDPQRTMTGSLVRDRSGEAIGMVRHIDTDETGAAVAAEVRLRGRGRLTTIPAQDLRFDQRSRSLLTDLTLSDMESPPR